MTALRFTVLGASGFIGSHLCRYLRSIDTDCFAPSRDDQRLYNEHLGHVIYSIGLTADFRTRPFDTVEAHVCFLSQFIQRAQFSSLTYLSSTRIYGQSIYTREDATLEVNPVEPGDLYNLSKLMGESLCLQCGHPSIKIARLSNIVGQRQDADCFIGQLLYEAEKYNRIQLKGSMNAFRDYLDIKDTISILVKIASSEACGIFNVASGEQIENQEIAHLISEAINIDFVKIPSREPSTVANIDISRIRSEFNFTPRLFHDYFPEFLNQYVKKRKS